MNHTGLFDTNGKGAVILVATIFPRRGLMVFKSKYDDQIDTITILAELIALIPSEVGPQDNDKDELEHSIMWGDDGSTKKAGDSSYFV